MSTHELGSVFDARVRSGLRNAHVRIGLCILPHSREVDRRLAHLHVRRRLPLLDVIENFLLELLEVVGQV